MPSSSVKQHNLMELVAHNPSAAERLGISQKVGHDFVEADKKDKGYKKRLKVRSKRTT